MKRLITWMLPIALLLVVCTPVYSAGSDNEREAAIAAIKKLGGRVTVDKNKRVVGVYLRNTKVTGDGLEHLKGLTNLQVLVLRNTKVTDAGLEQGSSLPPGSSNCSSSQD